MTTVADALTANRESVNVFLATVDAIGMEQWTRPRGPKKWSPSQVTEHVARSYEECTKICLGQPGAFPTLPSLLRPLMRGLFFNRVLRQDRFPNARTNKPMDPLEGPATPAAGRARLEAAARAFEAQARQMDAAGDRTVLSGTFGAVSLGDWVRFQAIHSHHHRAQLPVMRPA